MHALKVGLHTDRKMVCNESSTTCAFGMIRYDEAFVSVVRCEVYEGIVAVLYLCR